MSARLARLALAMVCGAASLSSAPAHAHVGHVILRAERYLKLDVSGREARVVVSLTLGEEEGERALHAADENRDGRVTAEESDLYLRQWGTGLIDEIPVYVDETRAPLEWREGYMSPLGEVRAAAVTLEMVARVTLDGGEQTVRIEDRMVRREVFDRTDVAFQVRDGAELLASGTGEAPEERVEALSYGPRFQEGEHVVLTARLRTSRAPDPFPWPWLALGAAALAAVALALWWTRRRRRARAAREDPS